MSTCVDFFFGRTDEIDLIYDMVFDTNLLMIYGASGTGKTSLVQCGLANRFQKTDWFDIHVRRKDNINRSIWKEIRKHALTDIPEGKDLPSAIQSLFLDFFKPIYLIFDQFEELFRFRKTRTSENLFCRTVFQQPPQIHLVLLTRQDPPLALSRLRGWGTTLAFD